MACVDEILILAFHLASDSVYCGQNLLLGHDELLGRIKRKAFLLVLLFSAYRVEPLDAFNSVPVQRDSDGVIQIRRTDFYCVAVDTEATAGENHIVSFVLHSHKLLKLSPVVKDLACSENVCHIPEGDRVGQAEYA